MVLDIEDVGVVDVVPGEHGVALAEVALAGAGLVFADGVTVLVAVTVLKEGLAMIRQVAFLELGETHLDKLADTGVTVLHAGTLEAVLVSFADCVKGIDWGTVTWVGHWSVA